ncbi:DUF7261 family protein [Halegenticoccus soli]|uniref:DUF7261 family protein n=1 Tax=Halegenticoccus soli TaxID=1985678 RepID=UPI000C6CA501|nr:hypothetical protein [Halegenticoccus soli]
MADVSGGKSRAADPRGRGGAGDARDRGQLFLVAGLTLAVVFVALALLLNAAIYAENVATRSNGAELRDAGELRGEAHRGVAGLVEYANYHNNSTTYAELDGAVRGGVRDWGANVALLEARRGHGAAVSFAGSDNGTRIVQYEDRKFANRDGDVNWTVADATRVRSFRANVTAADLEDGAPTSLNGAFNVTFSEAGDAWTVSLYESSGDVNVTVTGPGGAVSTCSAPGPRAEIDFTGGLVGGEDCRALAFFDGGNRTRSPTGKTTRAGPRTRTGRTN